MRLCAFIVIFCLTYLVTIQAHALKLSPFVASIIPTYDNATQVFRIENNSDEATAVQVDVRSWEMDDAGVERNEPADDLFVVFPAQVVIPPRESKAIRVQWLGDTDIEQELAFRLVVEQMPVALKQTSKPKSAVTFMVRFFAGLYVTPERGRSQIEIDKVENLENKLRLHMVNRGVKHSIINEPEITLTLDNGRQVQLSREEMKSIASENVHGGRTRYFDIAKPSGVRGNVVRGEIKYKQGF